MIILGIDPGTATTGFGAIKAREGKALECLSYGIIKTLPSSKKEDRLKKINNDLSKIIKEYRPEIMVMESLYFFKNLKTAIPVSQAGGVILLTAAKNKIPIREFTPLQAKLAITGFGLSEKKVVQEKIKKMLKLKEIPKPDDAADALALAIAFFLKKG